MTRCFFSSLATVGTVALALSFACGDDETGQVVPTTSSTQTTGASTGGSSTTSTTSGMAGNGMGGEAPSEYPRGPYGNNVGDTFPYLVWQGYLNSDPTMLSNTAPWTDTYTANDVHNSGVQYALIHTALST